MVSFGANCPGGVVSVPPSGDASCTVTNTYNKGSLTIIKHVINDDGTGSLSASDFTMHVSGTSVSDPDFPGAESPGTTVTLDPGAFSVSEDPASGYPSSPIFTGDCTGSIAAGQNLTCTVTNDDNTPPPPQVGELIVHKIVAGSAADPNSFSLFVDDMSVTNNVATTTSASGHVVTETPDPNYTTTFGNACDANGNVTVITNASVQCDVTNTLVDGIITVHKVVINHIDGTTTGTDDFQMKIDGIDVLQGTQIPVTANIAHTISETGPSGYDTTFSGACNGTNQVTVAPGQDITCTVTNEQQFGVITVTKTVINLDGGTLVVDNFPLFIDGNSVTSGVGANVAPGQHLVSETGKNGYNPTIGGACAANGIVNILAGQNLDCSVVNDDIPPSITLTKIIAGGGPISDVAVFDLQIDGISVSSGGTKLVTAGGAGHVISETVDPDYDAVISGSAKCPLTVPGSTSALNLAENISCTITNTFDGVDDNL